MWTYLLLMVFSVPQVFGLVLLKNSNLRTSGNESRGTYSIEELLHNVFPRKVSDDIYLDPCKAGSFSGDIALSEEEYSLPKPKIKHSSLQQAEKYKQEVLEGLQIEEEGLTDYIRKKTKQPLKLSKISDDGSVYTGTLSKNGRNRRLKTRQADTGVRRTPRAATSKKEELWDYGVIPYEIDANFSSNSITLFKQAMRHWENFTCLKFVERERDEHQNYIIFTKRPCGCCAPVGKKGGGQPISIARKCEWFETVVHELGHVIGFNHEHQRPDRDNYVKIIEHNIISGNRHNFDKLNESAVNSLGVPYDYVSVMHYPRDASSKKAFLDTIQPVVMPGGKIPEIRQGSHLSEGDIAQTNLLYKCPKCGGTFQQKSANFSAPQYHTSVPHDEVPEDGIRCEWRITATPGEKVVFNITELDIAKTPDCNEDYVEVRDGYWHKSKILGVFCGTGQVPSITSTGSRMLVTYVSKRPKGHTGFSANYEIICGGDLIINTEGYLESPNYAEYQPNKECIWRITVPEHHQVVLKFQSFDVQAHYNCSYEYLEIRSGITLDSPIIKVLCSLGIPNNVISPFNKMLVKYVTNNGIRQNGRFSAIIMKEYDECSKVDHGCAQLCINNLGGYVCSCKVGYELHSDGKNCEKSCGGVINAPNGTITSPSFPDLHPKNKICVWEILAQPQHTITLNFTHLDIQALQQQQCKDDRVDVFIKMKDGDMGKYGSFCGPEAPGLITSERDVMRIVFYSDISVQKTGFTAVFFSEMNECTKDNGNCQHECIKTLGSYICTCHSGYTLHENGRDCKEGECKYKLTEPTGSLSSLNYPGNYPANTSCVWHFIATPGHRVRIVFTEFQVEPYQGKSKCTYDYVEFFDDLSLKSSLGRFCGYDQLPHIVASGNQLYMTFKSDDNYELKGFSATHSTVCGGILEATTENKHIYSHSKYGSENYDNGVNCDWSIKAPPGYNVHLLFLTFDLEDSYKCGGDYVEIFEGLDSRQSYGKFCGVNMPAEMTSLHEALLVRFRTDLTLGRKGFSLIYVAVPYSSEIEM